MADFNRAINIGLKQVGRDVGIDGLQFYSARHSMATIAVNDVGISKYVVNDMLNHTDPALKVTELYIKRDFKIINVANSEVLNFVLGQTEGRVRADLMWKYCKVFSIQIYVGCAKIYVSDICNHRLFDLILLENIQNGADNRDNQAN